MKHINPPHISYNPAARLFYMLIFTLCAYIGHAQTTDLALTPQYSQLTVFITDNDNGLMDKTTVGFNPASTDTFSSIYDANKLMGLPNRETLYTLNTGQWMSINILPNEATVDTVDMGLYPGGDASFTFTFTGLSSFDTTVFIYLEDKKTNTWFNIRNGNYNFTSLSTDDWNRFVLYFTPPTVITGSNITCSATSTVNIQQPGMAYWHYTLADSLNAIVDSGIVNEDQSANVQVAPGPYTLTLTDTNAYVAVKTIQVSGPVPLVAVGFTVSDSDVHVMQPITLTDAVIYDSTNTNTYQWSFGNGVTGSGADTTIDYTKPGAYSLGLTVTNQSGCTATQIHTITVTDNQATAISNVPATENMNIWSSENRVYVDLTSVPSVDATITIYNILGQAISTERYTESSLYQKQFDNLSAAYLIVSVLNNGNATTKKVFVVNK